MSTVYLLLAALVWLVGFVSRLSRWLDDSNPAAPASSPAAAPRDVDEEVAAAIGAAVKAHRDLHSRR